MNTQEGNKLIAGFMGGTPNKRTFNGKTTTFWEGGDVPSLMLGASPSTKELRFHSDWNWLMPVVRKLCEEYGTQSALYIRKDTTVKDAWDIVIKQIQKWCVKKRIACYEAGYPYCEAKYGSIEEYRQNKK